MAESTRPLLLGHRGARSVPSIPENTLESFDRALADGCDGFEFDVRVTADGVAVVCHDPKCGGVEIATAPYSQLDQLPTLEDVLCRYRDRAFLDIELKVSGLEKITLELLQRYPPQRGFVVSSFLADVLLKMRAQNANPPLGLICETQSELLRWKELPVDYVIPNHRLATPALLSELKNAPKRVLVWTVNDSEEMVRFRDLAVDGIISDDTALLCSTIKNPH